jgi:hypothetical protein
MGLRNIVMLPDTPEGCVLSEGLFPIPMRRETPSKWVCIPQARFCPVYAIITQPEDGLEASVERLTLHGEALIEVIIGSHTHDPATEPESFTHMDARDARGQWQVPIVNRRWAWAARLISLRLLNAERVEHVNLLGAILRVAGRS